MYLKRLDLVGFKSFGVHTSTEFQPGIVVIVGPNGSGKSNVSDALLWVLGEQSAKAVRARKPEEVIFAGSASRQPLGMAEVSLVLDNSDSSLPIEYQEVRVTRRLYRSGESEYLLNGSRVRLKDITQLLLHAGLSPDSYTVVGQGSIDELILQRPDERRIAFENVADIRRHQLRLNETRSKLATTQANLVRVEDVLAELTPHVKRLKTQSDRAERAEQFRAELHELLVKTFRWRLIRAHADQREAEEQSARASADARAAENATRVGEQTLRALDDRLALLDDRFSELRPRADAFREQLRTSERNLAVVRERKDGTAEQHTSGRAELVRLQGALERLSAEEHDAALDVAHSADGGDGADAERIANARAELTQEVAALNAAQSERVIQQEELRKLDNALNEADNRLNRTQQHLHSLDSNLAVDQARLTDREARLRSIEELLHATAVDVKEVEERAAQTRARLEKVTRARTDAAARLERGREQLRVASQQADRLQGALAALGAAASSEVDHGDLPEDWRSALHGLPVVGLARELATRIRPLDLLLAGYLDRIVVLGDDASAREAHRRLTTQVRREAPAWAVLSMDGLLLSSEGARPLEAVEDQGQSTLADWSHQVRDLEEQLRQAEEGRHAAIAEVQAARDQLDDIEADERGARMSLGEVDARLAELRRGESTAQSERHELEAARERGARAAAQRQEERARTEERIKALADEVSAARTTREQAARQLREHDERLTTLSERVASFRADVVALEAVAGRRQAEREAREALHARIQAEIIATNQSIETISHRLTQLETQRDELESREVELSHEVTQLQTALEPIEQDLQSTEQQRVTLLAERQAAEQQLVVLRAAERAAHEVREARHVAAQRAADDVERLNTEIAETAELDAELSGDAAWAEQLRLAFDESAEPREAFDVEGGRRRIATLQRELRAVGGVAESVIAEYRELSERHAFLENQSADLRGAMAELEAAAAELESHMRERFSEAVSAIQTAFQECFTELFGGGEARLVLTDPDDLLRTGIDIVARPPGKKMQGLVSLSGGERALTVVSLLFGLLKINPTPFCVLDEVDAALDEANVQRFANLLSDFARRIQFIVVTHNRATMDKADAMYGVSMDAAGVSHVFSVRPGRVAEESRQSSAVS